MKCLPYAATILALLALAYWLYSYLQPFAAMGGPR
jgi:hypothetical protein